jgi:hypothetical protein
MHTLPSKQAHQTQPQHTVPFHSRIRSGYLLTPLPPCALLIDRHVHKNGGTTMRSIFMQNDKLDGWAFWGYGMRRMPAVASVLRLALLNKSTSCSSWAHRSPLRIAAELHYGNTLGPLEDSLMRYFGPASPLRQIAMRCTCKVRGSGRTTWFWSRLFTQGVTSCARWCSSPGYAIPSACTLRTGNGLACHKSNMRTSPRGVPQ